MAKSLISVEGGKRLKENTKISDESIPLVTIITATFNASSHLPKTIQSMRELTYKNVEWIVIDGGSTDQTIELIRKNEDVIDYWMSEPDDGIYDAWNKGVATATGEWIAFLGAGDTYYPESMTAYINVIRACNIMPNFICSRVQTVDECDHILRVWGDPFQLEQHIKYMTIAHVGALHHKSLFKTNGQFDTTFKCSADYDFFVRCGKNVNSLYLKQVTARMLSGGVSSGYQGIYETYLIQKKIKSATIARIRYFIACAKFFVRPLIRGY